jgi:coenzyme F420-0:L-glutamate ligase/coenzyme F420-1:gamma-L-glutamate ligase
MSTKRKTERRAVTLAGLPEFPLVQPGDDIAALIVASAAVGGLVPQDDDVFVIAQKVVSKAENRYLNLASIVPSPRAAELAASTHKDPRLVEAILSESTEVVRHREGVIIVAHRSGFVMANAGIDRSNLGNAADGERVLLLPEDADATCVKLKAQLDRAFGVSLGVIISDSFGRAWRNGVVGVALGAAGIPSLVDKVGQPDLFGRPMQVTEIAVADQIAAAATLVMGEADEGVPVVHLRGLQLTPPHSSAATLVRPKSQDMFR